MLIDQMMEIRPRAAKRRGGPHRPGRSASMILTAAS